MTRPIRATYRLQFRNGVTFAEASALAPFLASVGISHLYASPIFAATPGSTHGYDVVDHATIEPSLGGEGGFADLVAALKANGLSLLLDIVPNHMGAHESNPWWRDVLIQGSGSRYAGHFDIDWSSGKLTLPILGKPYGEALADGDITLAQTDDGDRVLRVPGADLPLASGTAALGNAHDVHEAQHYRLTHWRLARDGLNYRRFFEIKELVGVRVEDRHVFDDVHARLARMIASGEVDALRVDHVDGLADPAGYLERLGTFRVPVVVEKILEEGESLPDWPVDGTTGYEFVAGMAALFVEPSGLQQLSRDYAEVGCDDVAAMTEAAKRLIVTVNLRTELERLTGLAAGAFAADLGTRDHGPDTVRRGLVALLTAMPVYRTYVSGEPSAADRAVVETARTRAHDPGLDEHRVIDDLAALLLSEREEAVAFVTRFQQVSGPVMAKAFEDTLFYRHHRLIGLNEVGGSPEPHLGVARTMFAMTAPGLAATQTHDTKRGEDARARLYALSDPSAVALWREVRAALAIDAPEPWRWALAQMWLGALPLSDDPDFPDRLEAAALKSVREAKQETTWTRQSAPFERAVANAARALAGMNAPPALEPLLRAGAVVSLAQALLKTSATAAPDVYQGTFGWDFSLVDPDNRRPVDFTAEAALCAHAAHEPFTDLLAAWHDGAAKARVLLEGLRLRRERPSLFGADAAVHLLSGPDEPVAAFWRSDGAVVALIAVPRWPYRAMEATGLLLRPGAAVSRVELPVRVVCRLSDRTMGPGPVDLWETLAVTPVILAVSDRAPT